jgi:hypothetical protein
MRQVFLLTLLAVVLSVFAVPAPADASAAPVRAYAAAKKDLKKVRSQRRKACKHGARSRSRCRTLKAREARLAKRMNALSRKAPVASPRPSATPAPAAAKPVPSRPVATPTPTPTPTRPVVPAGAIHVAPTGDDRAAGTEGAPLATLTEALSRAAGGETIAVAPGSYPAASDKRARTKTVTVVGPGGGQAQIAGLYIAGGQELTLTGLSFTGGVSARYDTVRRLAQPARNIVFSNDDFTAPGGGCLGARNGVQGFTVTASRIHDCENGFGAAAGPTIPRSTGLTFTNNVFEHFSGDAIQFGNWDQVRITGNTIRDMRDPAGSNHNDGIQLTGYVEGVVIAGNRMSDSRHQLIFMQDALGPIDDVTVQNNLLLRAGGVAVQSQGVTAAKIVNNTIWDNGVAGLWLTPGFDRGGVRVMPTDTVVANNIVQKFELLGGVGVATAVGNVTACNAVLAPGSTCLRDVGFDSSSSEPFRLTAASAARTLGSRTALTGTDLTGLARAAAVPGAFR